MFVPFRRRCDGVRMSGRLAFVRCAVSILRLPRWKETILRRGVKEVRQAKRTVRCCAKVATAARQGSSSSALHRTSAATKLRPEFPIQRPIRNRLKKMHRTNIRCVFQVRYRSGNPQYLVMRTRGETEIFHCRA